ncbi:hypothetical protein U5B43_01705 [Campylobacter sp. 9BO]|uniref:hypothetical protein n=1 Tax=Campylobacter sp. 9BO TaxID=3424759 RepID=UPI003D339A57
MRLCPCERAEQSFAAMINGYFADDFTPDESYALICFLSAEFGYEFIGLSDKILLFRRTRGLDDTQSTRLLGEIAKIYGIKDGALSERLVLTDALLLPYIETLGDLGLDD